MGIKARPRATCDITIKRSDGYESKTEGLSYQAGMAASTLINRAAAGLPVRVAWDEGEVQVPGEGIKTPTPLGHVYAIRCYLEDTEACEDAYGETWKAVALSDGQIVLPDDWCFVKVHMTGGRVFLAPVCGACAEAKRKAGHGDQLVR